MAQNNIENQIREKLNAREIQPTEMAWDRLDAMLSVAEEKKTKRFPFFTVKNIGIAASILVFMSLGLFFINQKEEISNGTNTVVTKEIKNNNEQKDSVIKKQNFINETVSQQEEQVAVTINNQQSTINNQQSSKSFNSINQKTNQKSIINKEKEIEYQLTEVIAQKEMPKISFQEKVEQPKKGINVDEVVASMEKSPKKEAISKVKVNANSLLSQVDGELEQTFRQKVISKISKNYQEVKVALANRNQEY